MTQEGQPDISLTRALSLRELVPLGPLSTIGIGGTAAFLIDANDATDVTMALDWAGSADWPILVLGGGSNVLIHDDGFRGVVVRMANRGLTISDTPDADGRVLVRAHAGEPWDEFVAAMVNANLQGVEALSGIPGCVGGTPIQNVGAYGQEVAETIESVEVIDRTTLRQSTIPAADCHFAYRHSIFKGDARNRYVVTAVNFRLTPGGAPQLRYTELLRAMETVGPGGPSLAEVRRTVLAIRRSKGMVVDPSEPNSRSCGSFFMNPIVPREEFLRMEDAARRTGRIKPDEKFPHHDAGEGNVKLSAAWLMEHSGLRKGLREGGAGLSEKHILAIVNFGGATSADVQRLMGVVQQSVGDAFGVRLVPEPVFVGFPDIPPHV